MTLQQTVFENIVVKEEIAHNEKFFTGNRTCLESTMKAVCGQTNHPREVITLIHIHTLTDASEADVFLKTLW